MTLKDKIVAIKEQIRLMMCDRCLTAREHNRMAELCDRCTAKLRARY
jgi:uncharacterized paraquat-inducible protein A